MTYFLISGDKFRGVFKCEKKAKEFVDEKWKSYLILDSNGNEIASKKKPSLEDYIYTEDEEKERYLYNLKKYYYDPYDYSCKI